MHDKVIIHIDMDAFYASIEQRDNPVYKNKPLVVGGRSGRGVVSAASYEARRYGIHSAMSMERAKVLCRDLITIPSNMEKYKRESEKVFKILKKYTNIIEKISVDEAFLLIGKDGYKETIQAIKKEILLKTSLTASVGVSYNKFLAKLASDMDKPNGITILLDENVLEFLSPLPVKKILGVGPKMEKELNKLGLFYIGDIQEYSLDILESKFGKKGREIYQYAYGIDYREIVVDEPSQSIGEEETFLKDIDDLNFLLKKLGEQAKSVSERAKKKSIKARTITVKVKYYDFQVKSRSITVSIPINDYKSIRDISMYILKEKFYLNKNIRLIGLTLSNLVYPEDPQQLCINQL